MTIPITADIQNVKEEVTMTSPFYNQVTSGAVYIGIQLGFESDTLLNHENDTSLDYIAH